MTHSFTCQHGSQSAHTHVGPQQQQLLHSLPDFQSKPLLLQKSLLCPLPHVYYVYREMFCPRSDGGYIRVWGIIIPACVCMQILTFTPGPMELVWVDPPACKALLCGAGIRIYCRFLPIAKDGRYLCSYVICAFCRNCACVCLPAANVNMHMYSVIYAQCVVLFISGHCSRTHTYYVRTRTHRR